MGFQGWEQASLLIGFTLVTLGLLFLLSPLISKSLPSLERIPPIILYVYRNNGFVFATSPILIILALIYLIWRLISG